MSINIAEEVQKRLLFPQLQKIDPNDEPVKAEHHPFKYPVSQAAIATALAGLYKTTRTDADCEQLLATDKVVTWLEDIYGDNLKVVITRISEFCSTEFAEVAKLVKLAADASIKILHEQFPVHITAADCKDFMSSQRNLILVYIPVQLHLGEMLNDTTLDDSTNKMEGPVSSLMHKIENIFSEGS